MDKLQIEICMGTTCHIFGSSELLRVEDFIPEALKGRVEIRAVPCLSACNNDNFGGAPFVRVGGVIVQRASINAILDELNRKLEEKTP